MLVGALRELAARPSPIVSTAFFWRLLALEGFQPLLDACVRCGDDAGPFPGFDLDEGGVLCDACSRTAGGRVDPVALTAIGDLVDGRVAKVLADPPRPEVLADVERLAIRALEYHSERRLRSAALL
jgi:DNA repair protein RecO (recombination protein O)